MSLDQARQKICQLEHAVSRLEAVRNNLLRNASEICGDVRGSISRGIDCLRNREVNLLEQVGEAKVMKEECLHQQQNRLSQAINILRTAVSLVQENSANEKHLADTLERLNQLELSPEETPYIGFRADQLQMRENLLSYGRVDVNGVPTTGNVFEEPCQPSASLPRHVEEYDDADHHVFYKTLQDIQKSPDTSTSIREVKVNIPKLSLKTEDWLQKKPVSVELAQREVHSGSAAASRPSSLDTLQPGSAATTSAVTQSGSPAVSACSLNNWLTLIKQHADLEEEHDFEIFDNSYHTFHRAPEKICPNLQQWLSPASSPNRSPARSPVKQPGKQTLKANHDLFSHVSKDSKDWLQNVQRQLASVTQTYRTEDLGSGSNSSECDLFDHISREPSTWLRSRAGGRLATDSTDSDSSVNDFFSHVSKDLSKWLTPQRQLAKKRQNVDQSPSHAKWLLKDNGKRVSAPESSSTPLTMASNSNSSWLKPSRSTSQLGNSSPSDRSRFSHSTSDNSLWLLNNTPLQDKTTQMADAVTVETPATAASSTSEPMLTSDIEEIPWLLKSLHISSSSSTPISSTACCSSRSYENVFKNIGVSSSSAASEDGKGDGLWLRKDKKGQQSNQKELSMAAAGMPGTTADSLSEWLLVPAPPQEKEVSSITSSQEDVSGGNTAEEAASTCDSWSVCSTPHSVSADQHTRDVEVAADYYNRWLLRGEDH